MPLRVGAGIFSRIPKRWLLKLGRANRKRLPEPMRRAEELMGSERYWNRLLAKLEAMDSVAFSTLLRQVMDQEPVTDRLAEIRCPTLVLVGEQDEQFLPASRELADAIPDAKLVLIKDGHHNPQIEAQEEWLEAIHAHLTHVRTQ